MATIQTLLSLAVCLFAGLMMTRALKRLHLPDVTAYLIAGVLIGIPVLRLRGDYLAIVTLAFGEIIRNVMTCLYIDVNKKTGALQDVTDALEAHGCGYVIFDRVEENPSIETVMEARSLALAEGVDFATSANELFFLRSFLMYSVSISVVTSWASMAKGKSSARMFPFSHTMACPPKTRSVLLSPKPAPAYTYPAMHLALCVHTMFFMYSSFPAKAVSAARFRIISAPIRDRSVEGALGA